MTEMELLVDFHKDAERQGPGSHLDTLKALGMIPLDSNPPLRVADIGCGTGAQTLSLAGAIDGKITAVDLFPEFLEKLRERAESLGLSSKIQTLAASMDDLPFRDQEFDLIWSEGAVYNIGFREGVQLWKRFLKPGGHIALSEITWTTRVRPSPIESHWKSEYPQIDTASNKMKILEESGFSPIGYFCLPPSSWLEGYYGPMQARMEPFLEKHGHSEAARALVEAEKSEIAQFRMYKDFFSYGFYVARKL